MIQTSVPTGEVSKEVFVVVSGLPASGKSTLARALALALELPLFDKDDYLEALFAAEGVGDRAWRRRLSRRADNELRAAAEAVPEGVLTSFWRHGSSDASPDSGTPSSWLPSLPRPVVEVYCRCAPDVSAQRFLGRVRHEGHLDRLRELDELVTEFTHLAELGPLGVGRLVEVHTDTHVHVDRVRQEIMNGVRTLQAPGA